MKIILLVCLTVSSLTSTLLETEKLAQYQSVPKTKQLRHLSQTNVEKHVEASKHNQVENNPSSEDSSISFVSSRYHKLIDIPPTVDIDNDNSTEETREEFDQISSWKIIGFILLIWFGISLLLIPFIYFSVRNTTSNRIHQRGIIGVQNHNIYQIEVQNVQTDVRLFNQNEPKQLKQVNRVQKFQTISIQQQIKQAIYQESQSKNNTNANHLSKQLQIEEVNKSIHLYSEQSDKQQNQEKQIDYFKEPKMSNLLQKDSYIIQPNPESPVNAALMNQPEQYFSFSQIKTQEEIAKEETFQYMNQKQKQQPEQLSEIFKVKDSQISQNNCQEINEINSIIEKSMIKNFENAQQRDDLNENLKKQFLKDKDREGADLNKSFEQFVTYSKAKDNKQAQVRTSDQRQDDLVVEQ